MLTTTNTIKMADTQVKPQDLTTVYGTGKSKHLPEGQEIQVHSVLAKQLIGSGKATEEVQKGNKKKEV